MPKNKPCSNKPLISRPQRTVKPKKVFDPSDNNIPKRKYKKRTIAIPAKGSQIKKTYRSKANMKTLSPVPSSIHSETSSLHSEPSSSDSETSSLHSEPSSSYCVPSSSNCVPPTSNSESESSSSCSSTCSVLPNSKSSASHDPVNSVTESISEELGSCYICAKNKRKWKMIKCPICSVKIHKKCLMVIQPLWKFKLDACPWLCTECRNTYCGKCHKQKPLMEILYCCFVCKVGLHDLCYHSYEIKPLHKIKHMYICIPCMTLATQPVVKVEGECISSTSEEEHERDIIPDVQTWDKYTLHKYLLDHLPKNVADKVMLNNIDGMALMLLERKDITCGMNLLMGDAMRLYKQVRILQTRKTTTDVYWE